ncbi:MAG: transglutaminase family protein [Acidobacteriota bacterium]|nr:transglutaminase family protein [Acidobacteriota bacterium]
MAEAIHYDIEHLSRYHYTRSPKQCVMMLCLKPQNDRGQRVLSFDIETDPASLLTSERDGFGNTRHVFNLDGEHRVLEIVARSTVSPAPFSPLPHSLGAGAWIEIQSWKDSFALWDFIHPSPLTRPSSLLAQFVDRYGIQPGRDPLEGLLRLSDTLHQRLRYAPGSTSVMSSIEQILKSGRGVCQDYAHTMIAIARSWGIPARYVSGYLHLAGLDGEQAAGNATHAWVECLLPELGWVGFDPTNRCLADERHVRIAVGRDYRDVSPTRGILRGGESARIEVAVKVSARTDSPGTGEEPFAERTSVLSQN